MELDIRGIRREVSLRPQGRLWVVTVDGRESTVDARRVGERWSLIMGPDGGSGASYEVAIEERGPGELNVSVNGHAVAVVVPQLRRFGNGPARVHRAGSGPLRIRAPMPGRVVKVLVGHDAAVVAGQPLVIVEAMKMENELRSPKGGRVTAVMVTEGMSVEAGAPLLVVEPEPLAGDDGRKAE